MIDAFVDSREPDEVKLKCAKGNANGEIVFDTTGLPQADFYLPEHDVAIERKEASDFASSTTKGRLSEQADRMMAEHDHNFLILENTLETSGALDDRRVKSLYNLDYSNISDNSIIGMQTSLAVKRDFKIIYTESVEQTIYAVNRIFERFVDEEHENADSGYVKTSDTGEVDDVQVSMLMQIEGISEDKARSILDIKSFSWYTYKAREDNAQMRENLMRVDGVGPTLAQRVIDAFQ